MQSRALLTTLRLAPIALLGLGCMALVEACSAGASNGAAVSSTSDDAAAITAYTPEAGVVDAPPDAAVEAMSAAIVYQGNPLCQASQATSCCYPDTLSTCEPATCPSVADAGAGDTSSGYSQVINGCHLAPAPAATGPVDATTATGAAPVSPACMPAGLGLDGALCTESNDCAPGYECVGGGTCRHYCCAGNSACRLDQFCDIQQTAGAASMNVPVCMPVHQCDLLKPITCPAGQTCAVVREDGSQSCVASGSAAAGQSCETEHCASGLVCLGATARTCYALCQMVGGGQCPAPQTCKGGPPLFQDPGVGICQ